jgi:hypothetical protein
MNMPSPKMVQLPDGQGGWKMVAADAVSTSGPHSADTAKRSEAEQAIFMKAVTDHMNRVIQVEQQFAKDMGLTREQRGAAAALYAINIRNTYPSANGKPAPTEFDTLAAAMQDIYDAEVKTGA